MASNVNKISIEIALEGGELIKQQLEGIGEAGKQAFDDISKAAEQAGGFNKLDPGVVTGKLQELGVTGEESINKITAAVKQAGQLESLVGVVRNIEGAFAAMTTAAEVFGGVIALAVVAAGAAFAAAVPLTLSFAQALNKVNEEAVQLGVNTVKLDELRGALGQAGISADAISTALQSVNTEMERLAAQRVASAFKDVQDAANTGADAAGSIRLLTEESVKFTPAGKAAAEALFKLGGGIPGTTLADVSALGTEVAKLKGLTGIDFKVDDDAVTRLRKIVDALALIPDDAQRAAVALELLKGKAGEFAAAFKSGKLEEFKLGISQEDVTKANELDQAINRLRASVLGTSSLIIAPLLTRGLNLTNDAVVALNGYIKNFSWDSFIAGAEAAGAFLLTAIPKAVAGVGEALGVLVRLIGGVIASFVTTPVANAWEWIKDTLSSAMSAAIDQAKQLFESWVTTPVANAWQWIKDAFNSTVAQMQGLMDLSKAALRDWVLQPIEGAFEWVVNAWNKALSHLTVIGGVVANPQDVAVGAHASGGLLGGRGTGTSDSNLAWVSRGEHIMPARAVAQPGVLALLEMLRLSGGNLRAVLDSMGRFALGGVVPPMLPAALAGAGGGGNLGTLHLALPDGGTVSVRATDDVVDRLRKAAALAQVRSGGRKPSRYS